MKPEKSQSSLMTLKEVCAYLKVKPRTIYSLIHQGQLAAIKIGKEWRFRQEDVEDYLKRKQFRYGTTSIEHKFFRPQVLNKYKKESMSGQKYYLHDQAYDGRVGNRQDYHDVKTLTSMKRKLPKGYLPFVDVHYRKVTLRNGTLAIVLSPEQYKSLPTEEYAHWAKFLITKPELI